MPKQDPELITARAELAEAREQLADAQAQIDALQSAAADAEARAATAQAELVEARQRTSQLETELTAAQEELAAAQGEVGEVRANAADARAQANSVQAELVEARQELRDAALRYRDARLAAAPQIPQDLVPGADALDEIDQQFEAAQRVVEQLRGKLQAETQSARVPVGSPPRRPPDLSGLSPTEKIKLGLEQLAER